MRLSTLFLLTAVSAANAGVVTVDAASFSVGANITTATPGISLYEVANYGLGPAINQISFQRCADCRF